MTRQTRWGEVTIGLGTLVFALIVGFQVAEIPSDTYARVGPQAIPWVVTFMLGAFGAALAIQAYIGHVPADGDAAPADPADEHGAFDLAGALWMTLGLFLNVALIEYAGFIIASTLMFVCIARAFGSRQPLRDGAIGLVLAVVAYVGFDRVLGYKIGSGLIESLI